MDGLSAFIGLAQLFVSIIDVFGKKKNQDELDKRKVIELIELMQFAISSTLSKSKGNNTIKEEELSNLWKKVSNKASELKQREFQELAQQTFEKSLYWSNGAQNDVLHDITIISISEMNNKLSKIRNKLLTV